MTQPARSTLIAFQGEDDQGLFHSYRCSFKGTPNPVDSTSSVNRKP